MKDFYDIIKRPLVTEKSMKLTEEGKYTFEVSKQANKIEVKEAVEKLFNVDVVKVNLISVKPKKKRVGRHEGYKSAYKKAIVKLAIGQRIDKFDI